MPDWKSVGELEHDNDVFVKLVHSFTGVYIWEYFVSLDFDLAFVTRRKPFRWPMIFYFANRYLLLCALAGILVAFDSPHKIDCQALCAFIQLTMTASAFASINLCLRTIAVYQFSKPMIAFLVILILCHWALILTGMQMKEVWSDEQHSCVVVPESVNVPVRIITSFYSACFNFILFFLNAYKLHGYRRGQKPSGESQLIEIIISDGLIYFFVSSLMNVLATVFMFLNLNPIVENIFSIPVAIISTICATRVIRRLSDFFKGGDADALSGFGTISSIRFRSVRDQSKSEISTQLSGAPFGLINLGGVHVHTETFTRAEVSQLQNRGDRDTDSELEVKMSPA